MPSRWRRPADGDRDDPQRPPRAAGQRRGERRERARAAATRRAARASTSATSGARTTRRTSVGGTGSRRAEPVLVEVARRGLARVRDALRRRRRCRGSETARGRCSAAGRAGRSAARAPRCRSAAPRGRRRSGGGARPRTRRARPPTASAAARAAGRGARRAGRRSAARRARRARLTGMLLTMPPSMKCSPPISTGGRRPGTAAEARTASTSGPSANQCSAARSMLAATH